MEGWLKEFQIPAKSPSEEDLRRWRSAVFPVRNSKRRFRNVAHLDKRSEAEEKKKEIKEFLKSARMLLESELAPKGVSSFKDLPVVQSVHVV